MDAPSPHLGRALAHREPSGLRRHGPHAPSPAAPATGPWAPGGIAVHETGPEALARLQQVLTDALQGHALTAQLQLRQAPEDGCVQAFWPLALQQALAPGHDTLELHSRLGLPAPQPGREAGDAPETAAALLLGPHWQDFPSVQELASALRVRRNVARAAARTMLDFDTEAVERPWEFWHHDDSRGFHIREGVSLIDALRQATQPEVSGARYAFSCYRATEYVLLLGLAEELQQANPPLYAQLQALWRRRAIVSAEFHEVFLRETGSLDAPLPPRYYVPGDRVWFRNPDEASADAAGFEGSWVIYLGGGHFCNFWEKDRPFDFETKCLEVHHWRDGLWHDAQGEARIDEARVAQAMARTRADPAALARILARMQRFRDPRGVYAEGGCIDSTREQLRWVCPGSADLRLPAE
ncbi:hypothetical protein PGB34_13580 [Xenophilus arseniciresistens]|uniref:Uncharacterized protein n=1 Tax=Xenophilus arseniciresistens TaxID=1283306 RepID=A0AAE3T0A4_9BURK|nr:hypothetical protein [Xenophilus arseniciresistens]MDA7417395.1 hypothetical protein [Xenophilus arseniciresistens]